MPAAYLARSTDWSDGSRDRSYAVLIGQRCVRGSHQMDASASLAYNAYYGLQAPFRSALLYAITH